MSRKPLTEEHKQKIRVAITGRVVTWGNKISKSNKRYYEEHVHHCKGIKLSEEHKRKIGEAHRGKGHSEETRKKISESLRGRSRAKTPKMCGSSNPNWRGGISPEKHRIRSSIEYRLWRAAVYARDNWTCQKCGKRGGHLAAHHIESFAACIALRTSISNGVTFCRSCHKEFHRQYGQGGSTREKLVQFLE